MIVGGWIQALYRIPIVLHRMPAHRHSTIKWEKSEHNNKKLISVWWKKAPHIREINRAEEVVNDAGCHLITS